jgi:hypothetical protein
MSTLSLAQLEQWKQLDDSQPHEMRQEDLLDLDALSDGQRKKIRQEIRDHLEKLIQEKREAMTRAEYIRKLYDGLPFKWRKGTGEGYIVGGQQPSLTTKR